MNLIANAIDALDEIAQKTSYDELKANPQCIELQTDYDRERGTVAVKICDNGGGIPESLQAKIFEHLFTTKGVGKGRGLDLAISRQIVVEKHGGELTVDSELGRGTTFCIRLPRG